MINKIEPNRLVNTAQVVKKTASKSLCRRYFDTTQMHVNLSRVPKSKTPEVQLTTWINMVSLYVTHKHRTKNWVPLGIPVTRRKDVGYPTRIAPPDSIFSLFAGLTRLGICTNIGITKTMWYTGVPVSCSLLNLIFHCKPTSYWGSTNPPYIEKRPMAWQEWYWRFRGLQDNFNHETNILRNHFLNVGLLFRSTWVWQKIKQRLTFW